MHRRQSRRHAPRCRLFDDRTLVDVGVLVRAGVFDQVVNIHTDFTGHGFVVVHANHQCGSLRCDQPRRHAGLYRCARVNRHGALNPRTDNRFFSAQTRNGLTLRLNPSMHGSHHRARGTESRMPPRKRSAMAHVHVLHALWRYEHGFARFTRRNQLTDQSAFVVHFRIRLRDDVLPLFNRRQIVDFVGHFHDFQRGGTAFRGSHIRSNARKSPWVNQTNVLDPLAFQSDKRDRSASDVRHAPQSRHAHASNRLDRVRIHGACG